MCLQCTTNPVYFSSPKTQNEGGRFLPDFTLMRARVADAPDMNVGDWGLVECNDPSIIFHTTPLLKEDCASKKEYYVLVDQFTDEMMMDPLTGLRFATAFNTQKPVIPILREYAKAHAYSWFHKLYIYTAWMIKYGEIDSDNDLHSEFDVRKPYSPSDNVTTKDA